LAAAGKQGKAVAYGAAAVKEIARWQRCGLRL